MALKDCTFFVDVNGKQVEMDYDQFRSYLLDGTNLSALAPTLAQKKGAKAGFETAKAAQVEKKPAAKPTAKPVAGQVETVTAEPSEAERIADSVGKQKMDAQGFTSPQREFLVEKTREVYEDIQNPSTPSKYVIKVPGDGQFTISSPTEANGLHRRLTGQNVPGAISKHHPVNAPPISKAENLGARGDAYSNLFNPIRTAFTGLGARLFTKDAFKESKFALATPAGLETAPESGLYPLAQHRAEAGVKNVSTDKDFITDGSILVLTSAMSSGKAEKVKAASEEVRRPDASKVRQVWTDAVNNATVPAEIAGVWQSSTAEGLALIDTPNGLITISPERLNAAVKMTNADGIMIASNATAASPVILTRNGQPVGMIAPLVYKTQEAAEKAVAGAREALDEMKAEGKSPTSLSANLSKPAPSKPVKTQEQTQAAPQSAKTKQAQVVGFVTAKGSTYVVDEQGRTLRTKRSEGKGQGETYPAHTVLYLEPRQQAELMDAMRDEAFNRPRIVLGYITSNTSPFTAISKKSDIPAGAYPLVALAVKGPSGNSVRTPKKWFRAETEPKVGFHPVEVRRAGGEVSTHLGNQIISLTTTADVAGVSTQTQATPAASEPNAPQPVTVQSLQDVMGINKSMAEAVMAVYKAMGIPLPMIRLAKGAEASGKEQAEGDIVRGSIYFNSKAEQAQMDGVLAVIRGFDAANVTTPIHEGAHFYRRFMLNVENGFTPEEIKAAEDWAGAKNGKWSVKAEEKWARGFERYLRSGESPLPSLAKLFEKMAKWFQGIYKVVAGSPIDVEITPEIKRVFDRIFKLQAERVQASKGPQTLKQEVKGPSGETKAPVWRSNIVEALGDWKQSKGTPAQLMAHLNKTKGAAEEAKWIGLNEFLQDKPTVTRAQIEDFVSKNPYIVSDTTIKEGSYSGYTLYGGSNYREIILTSPKVPFTSGHFSNVPNYLAHMRVKNFKDSEGRKVLLVEEAQSDLHQKGRKAGYETPETQRKIAALNKQLTALQTQRADVAQDAFGATHKLAEKLADPQNDKSAFDVLVEIQEFHARIAQALPQPPLRRQGNTPTVTGKQIADFASGRTPTAGVNVQALVARAGLRDEFHEVLGKLQLRHEVAGKIAQAEKSINKIKGDLLPDAPFKGSENWGVMVFKRAIRMAVEEGADVVAWTPGKVQQERYHNLGGDLSTFYDKILPTALGKFVRQWGGKVETIDLTPSLDSKESLRLLVTDELRGQIRYFETRLEEASDEGYDDEGRTTEEILHELNGLHNSLGEAATASDAELNRMLSELPAGPGAAFYEQTPREGFPAIVITPQMKGEAEKGFTLFQAEGVPEDKKGVDYAEIGRKIAERRAEAAKKAKEGQAAAPPQPSAKQQARPTGPTRRPLKVKPPESLEEMLFNVEKDIQAKAGKASRTSQEEANYRADREVRSLLKEYALKAFQGRFGDELELPDGTKVSRRAELLSAIAELQAILKDPALRQNQRLIDRAKVYRRIDYALLAPPKVSKKINPSLRNKLTGHAWGEWSPRSPLSYAQYIGSYERLAGATGRDVSDTFNIVRTMFARGQYRNFAGAMSDLRLRLRPLKDQLREQGYHGLPALIDAHVERLEEATRNIGELTWANVKKAWDENPVNLVSTLAKAFIFNTKLRFSVKSMGLNFIQPLSTLYPYFTTSELLDLYKRSLTKSEIERVRAIAIAESGGRFTQEMREGVKSRLPNPFQRSSEQVRIMGHLAGEMLADRDKMLPGIERDMFIRSWAEKAEFDNSPWNIGPLFSGPIASVLLQFKPFMFKNLERFVADIRPYKTDKSWITARQTKVIMAQLGIGGMSSLMTLVPVVGTALIGPGMLALLAKSLGAMADDDELGEQMAEAFYYGVPSLFGVDLSSSVEFISEPMGKTAAEQVLNVIGGPLVATSVSAYTQGKDMVSLAMRPQKVGEKEEVDKKLREKALRLSKSITPLAGMAEAAAGLATGNRPTMFLNEKEPYTTGETARKMFGFTPLRQTMYYDRKESPAFIQKFAGRQPDVPGITREKGETDATYRVRVQRVEEYRQKYGDQLLAHPRYKTLDEETKQKALEIINGNISTESAKKRPDVRNLNPLYVMRRAKESVRQAPRREKKQLYVPPDED